MRIILLSLLAACAPSQKKIDSFTRPTDPNLKVEGTSDEVARGAYIANSVGACIVCHSGRPEGYVMSKEPLKAMETSDVLGGFRMDLGGTGKMTIAIPNITPHPETGVGKWTDDEIIRAIRDGIRPDGTKLLAWMPIMQYQYMSDADAKALVAYIRSLAPVDKDVGEHEMPGLFENIFRGIGHEPVASVPEPDKSNPVVYGEYLTKVAHCSECHSAAMKPRGTDHELYLAGSAMAFNEFTGKYPAPNLTPDKETGIGNYTPQDVVNAIRNGTNLNGEPFQPPMSIMADVYRNATDEDLMAIAQYLFSLQPVAAKLKPRTLNEQGLAYAEARKGWLAERATTEAARKAELEAARQAAEAGSASTTNPEGVGTATTTNPEGPSATTTTPEASGGAVKASATTEPK